MTPDPDLPRYGEDFEVCAVGTLALLKRLRARVAELEAGREREAD